MIDKCQWCGMDPNFLNPSWKCGSRQNAKGSRIQSEACAEIARLSAKVTAALTWTKNRHKCNQCQYIIGTKQMQELINIL